MVTWLKVPLAAVGDTFGTFGRVMILALAGMSCIGSVCEAAEPEILRLGFSSAVFGGLNENDAKASIKALMAVISRERSVPADTEPHLHFGTDAIVAAVKQGTVNTLSVGVTEYWILRRDIEFDGALVSLQNGDPTETYIVLTHANSGINSLPDLRGRRVGVLANIRMSLALSWLDVELAKLELPGVDDHFAQFTESTKPAKVVLPVFFQQLDACVVSESTFRTMTELNPQLGRQLRIVAKSAPHVPALFAFTARLSPAFRDRVMRELSAVDETPSGRQVLAIFQTTQVRSRPESVLRSALDLLDEHARLRPAASAARIAALRAPPAGDPLTR